MQADHHLEELQARLQALHLDGLRTADATEIIKEAIESWADERGWSHRREVPIDHVRVGSSRTGGVQLHRSVVDLVVDRPGATSLYIEIDSSNKRTSLVKLIACVQQGADAMWVRFGRSVRVTVPREVRVLEVPWSRPTRRRSDQDQAWEVVGE